MSFSVSLFFFFFFNDTATTEIYTLSLHDALPISSTPAESSGWCRREGVVRAESLHSPLVHLARRDRRLCSDHSFSTDRKSTRLNSSHTVISYAVFCLKKKNGGFHTHHIDESTAAC